MNIKRHQSLSVLLASVIFTSSVTFDPASARGRGGNRGYRGSSARSSRTYQGGKTSPRLNNSVKLKNKGNFNQKPRKNRSKSKSIHRKSVKRNNSRNINRSVNRNVNVNVNRDTNWYRGGCRVNCWGNGGSWWGGGYYPPPGWGAFTFAAGLTLGAALNSPPPYYESVYVGSTHYIYSDGIYMQPTGTTYVVIKPPIGAEVTYLPDGCKTTPVGDTLFYTCSGIVYEPSYRQGVTVYRVVRY